ncbi:hypothetical protein BZZ01_32065 [Nostocales cyanobacterium HT-58-2]|nr:hypothetical protein BZZ01_32065 [Nostocales cyanobacterium HT-58-2]
MSEKINNSGFIEELTTDEQKLIIGGQATVEGVAPGVGFMSPFEDGITDSGAVYGTFGQDFANLGFTPNGLDLGVTPAEFM